MNGLLSSLFYLAQATPPAPAGAPQPGWFQALQSLGPLVLIFIVFLFVMQGSKRKQERERKTLMTSMKKGDRVQTIGGMLATVHEVRDDRVSLKIDETSNAKAWFIKSAIHKVITDEAKPA